LELSSRRNWSIGKRSSSRLALGCRNELMSAYDAVDGSSTGV
jgi:hypothetical protein